MTPTPPALCEHERDMIETETRAPKADARWGARAAALVAALTLLTACGNSEGDGTHFCTLIDSLEGIGVKVAPKLANRVADAALTVCWDGTCQKRVLRLREDSPEAPESPGNPVMTTATPTTPETPAPETPATETPGSPQPVGLPGFAIVHDLPEKPVRVTLTFKDRLGATVLDRHITITPKPTYPNGRNCPPSDPQAVLTVSEDGSLTAR